VPIIAAQDTVQVVDTAVSGTGYVDCACETAPLEAGVKYWVVALGSCGADTTSRRAYLQLMHGVNSIGESGGEGALTGAQAYGSPGLRRSTCVTGTGATLRLQLKGTAGVVRAGAMFIHAMPLTALTAGVDYHEVSTDAATEVVSNADTVTPADVFSQSFDFGASQPWLLFGSFEMDFDAFTAARGSIARLLVGGTPLDSAQRKEGENAADIYNAMFVTQETLAGSVAIKMDVLSVGTAETDARRPSFFALRVGALAQVVHAEFESARIAFTSATYVDLGQLNASITPVNTGARCLVLYSGNTSSTGATALSQIRNDTAATAHCVDSGEGVNGTSADETPWLLAHCAALSATTAFKAQVRSSGGTTVRWPAISNYRLQVSILELATA
jgi:hypothetical protein